VVVTKQAHRLIAHCQPDCFSWRLFGEALLAGAATLPLPNVRSGSCLEMGQTTNRPEYHGSYLEKHRSNYRRLPGQPPAALSEAELFKCLITISQRWGGKAGD